MSQLILIVDDNERNLKLVRATCSSSRGFAPPRRHRRTARASPPARETCPARPDGRPEPSRGMEALPAAAEEALPTRRDPRRRASRRSAMQDDRERLLPGLRRLPAEADQRARAPGQVRRFPRRAEMSAETEPAPRSSSSTTLPANVRRCSTPCSARAGYAGVSASGSGPEALELSRAEHLPRPGPARHRDAGDGRLRGLPPHLRQDAGHRASCPWS